jgi:hypothetical protein
VLFNRGFLYGSYECSKEAIGLYLTTISKRGKPFPDEKEHVKFSEVLQEALKEKLEV